MENPHAEKQAILLERIIKNVVCLLVYFTVEMLIRWLLRKNATS